MGRLMRSAAAPDALQDLSLDEKERSCIHAMKRSAGYHFTLGVQRSWCVRRAGRASLQTLSMLPAELRRRLIDDWIACGGGTSSFEAIEAEAMLEFIAGRLPTPSHEWTVCRFEQAAMRVHEGTFSFETPDTSTLDASGTVIRRGRYAGRADFYGGPGRNYGGLISGKIASLDYAGGPSRTDFWSWHRRVVPAGEPDRTRFMGRTQSALQDERTFTERT
jgi:hypothetical protein